MDLESSDQDGIARTLAAADDVIAWHVPDADGWCLGCLASSGRLVFVEECTHLTWAIAVRARYGGGTASAS